MRVKFASYSQLLAGTSTNDARASNPAKNWSHKSARHLQKTRARNLSGDTRGLPEAVLLYLHKILCGIDRKYYICYRQGEKELTRENAEKEGQQ